MPKFTMEMHLKRMQEIRDRFRQPEQAGGLQRLKDAIRRKGVRRV